jgi:hypothetical protein
MLFNICIKLIDFKNIADLIKMSTVSSNGQFKLLQLPFHAADSTQFTIPDSREPLCIHKYHFLKGEITCPCFIVLL